MFVQPTTSRHRVVARISLSMNEAPRPEKVGDLTSAGAGHEHAGMTDVQGDAVLGRSDACFVDGNETIVGARQSGNQAPETDRTGAGDDANLHRRQQGGARQTEPARERVSDKRRQHGGLGEGKAAMATRIRSSQQNDAAYAR